MAQTDPFKGSNVSSWSPPRKAQAVDLTNTDFVPANVTKSFYVGTPGDVAVILADDGNNSAVVLPAMQVGLYAIQVRTFVKATTTAGNLVALFG